MPLAVHRMLDESCWPPSAPAIAPSADRCLACCDAESLTPTPTTNAKTSARLRIVTTAAR
jgi:hypothetical protein